ncbi:unnamed protein product [Brassicogethes aeneus]|uniref:Uncharacterized protein n=1 Tax=Brassicogethes aeneus TaxID=1431903 RepID=A0A9P0FMD2_BRAAE|nr:unnamed protein product [Brassicogethes aeneus]
MNRQSGWELGSSGDRLLDLVKWVHHLIQVSAPRRKDQENLSSLFITTRGEVKAASRSIIAGWFKKPFKDLGIDMGPGSIRSAVASFDFQNNVSLDSILEKGLAKALPSFGGEGTEEERDARSSLAPSRLKELEWWERGPCPFDCSFRNMIM